METTIVISNYNYSRFLPSAVNSCKMQEPCQIIIVDDASTDDSWTKIVAMASQKDPDHPILGIRLKNTSGGNARGKNIGIAYSKTPYIVCLDSDDMLLPGSLSIRRNHLKNEPRCGWIHGKCIRVESEGDFDKIYRNIKQENILNSPFRKIENYITYDVNHYRRVEASTVMAHRSVYEQCGLYDEELKWKIDREMWHRLLSHDCPKISIDAQVSIYRKHNQQVTKNPQIKQPQKIDNMFRELIVIRQVITPENTLMLNNYDYKSFIDRTVGSI